MKTEIIYGYHPVREAFRAGRRKVYKLYVARGNPGNRFQEIFSMAESSGVVLERTTPMAIQAMSRSENHQDICAQVAPYPIVPVEDFIIKTGPVDVPPFFLVIDSVLDPRNLGALLRSGLAVGVRGVVTPKDRSAPPTAAVSKASAGALEHVQLARVTNLSRALEMLKSKGLWIFGLDRAAEHDIFRTSLNGPMALVVGGEEKGIRPLVKQHCDVLVSIPQCGPLDSLNASVAGAVAMYEVLRQRRL